jgi:hypothetical protein
MTEYDPMSLTKLPQWLKMVMVFIDRVGFPILAFIMMFCVCYISIDKTNKALNDNTKALAVFTAQSCEFQDTVMVDHKQVYDEVRRNGDLLGKVLQVR